MIQNLRLSLYQPMTNVSILVKKGCTVTLGGCPNEKFVICKNEFMRWQIRGLLEFKNPVTILFAGPCDHGEQGIAPEDGPYPRRERQT